MSGFGSNIASLQAQRWLSRATSTLSHVFERLSSGQRINRASDDAAGLAIADGLKVKVRLYTAGLRNINDALSMINIADGTLENQTSILIRLKELAEQSANGVFTSVQRETMQREYQSLVREFGRLGDTASFNGISLLRSQGSITNIQAGIDGRSQSNISFTSGETGTISGIFDITAHADPAFQNMTSHGTLAQLVALFGADLMRTTVVDSSGASHEVLIAIHDASGAGYEGQIKVHIFAPPDEVNHQEGSLPGDEWELAGSKHFFVGANGRAIENPISTLFVGSGTTTVTLDLSALRFTYSSGAGAPLSSIDFTGIENLERARRSLEILDTRLAELSTLRGQYGATQSRLLTALALLESSRESSQSAESRIRDADIASEAARMTASNILQQTAASVLATANRQPQLLLDLLR